MPIQTCISRFTAQIQFIAIYSKFRSARTVLIQFMKRELTIQTESNSLKNDQAAQTVSVKCNKPNASMMRVGVMHENDPATRHCPQKMSVLRCSNQIVMQNPHWDQ